MPPKTQAVKKEEPKKEVPKKETTTAPKKETTPAPKKETTPAPKKETTTAPKKETTPAPKKETTPAPKKETTTAPKKETPAPKKTEAKKETTPAPKKTEAKKETAPAKKAETTPAKKTDTKKETAPAKKADTKKVDTKKAETKKADTKKETTSAKKTETKKEATKTVKKDSAKKEVKKADTKKETSTKTGKTEKRKAPEAPTEQVSKKAKTEKAHVGPKKPRNFSIGNDIQPKRDLTRFVKWPRYILMQRKKRVLQHRLKVPPSINQFTKTLDTNTAANLFKFLNKYRPEDSVEKNRRLIKIAAGKLRVKNQKPLTVKCGINHVTKLIEDKKAALVVIAHDVDPIELVLFLPALCRKQNIPYCFVKGKARLGQLVHKKTATAVALKGIRTEDRQEFGQLLSVIRANYNDKYEEMKRKWGGGIMGLKSQAVTQMREKLKKQEDKKKAIKFK